MKRIIFALACFGLAIAQPTLEKPVVGTTEVWEMTGTSYMRVTLTDGSTVELRSPESLTKAEWQKLADDYQKGIDAIPEPKECPTCGQFIP